jgi:hypothetical protein
MSIWVSCPARVEASDDAMCAAVALVESEACSPLQRADWYVLHAVATAAIASSTVARSSTRCCLLSSVVMPDRYENTFTALAITSPKTISEISDCSAIVSFAHGVMGMTSVGLNAVLVVSPSMR